MEKSGFFNSVNGDRRYKCDFFAEYFATFIGNGVFPNPSTNLQVITNDNMTVTIKPGKAWINGYYYNNTDDLIVPIEVADGVLDRIDRIVLKYDTSKREIKVVIKKGQFASSPTVISLQRDADAYELGLVDIYIKAGAISIVQANITDLRLDKTICGIVHGTVDQVDTTAIFNQFQDWYSKTKDNYDKDITKWTEDKKSIFDKWYLDNTTSFLNQFNKWYGDNTTKWTNDFNTWFSTVKGLLDGDIGAKLAAKTLDLESKISTLNGAGDIKEKANKDDLEKYKATVSSQIGDTAKLVEELSKKDGNSLSRKYTAREDINIGDVVELVDGGVLKSKMQYISLPQSLPLNQVNKNTDSVTLFKLSDYRFFIIDTKTLNFDLYEFDKLYTTLSKLGSIKINTVSGLGGIVALDDNKIMISSTMNNNNSYNLCVIEYKGTTLIKYSDLQILSSSINYDPGLLYKISSNRILYLVGRDMFLLSIDNDNNIMLKNIKNNIISLSAFSYKGSFNVPTSSVNCFINKICDNTLVLSYISNSTQYYSTIKNFIVKTDNDIITINSNSTDLTMEGTSIVICKINNNTLAVISSASTSVINSSNTRELPKISLISLYSNTIFIYNLNDELSDAEKLNFPQRNNYIIDNIVYFTNNNVILDGRTSIKIDFDNKTYKYKYINNNLALNASTGIPCIKILLNNNIYLYLQDLNNIYLNMICNSYVMNLYNYNNTILGIALESVKAGNSVTIGIKGIQKVLGVNYSQITELYNNNGVLSTDSYNSNKKPYALAIDVDTIDIVNPYSKNSTI